MIQYLFILKLFNLLKVRSFIHSIHAKHRIGQDSKEVRQAERRADPCAIHQEGVAPTVLLNRCARQAIEGM